MITLTASAEIKLKNFLAEQGDVVTGVRISVAGGGCSGFQYGMTFDSEKPGDLIQDVNGLNIYMDSESVPLLQGLEINYVDSLDGAGFQITNPNAKSSCGCGKSFSA